MPKPDPKFYIWCDIETTGLDPVLDPPLEIAVMVTTPDLKEVDPVRRFHSLLRLTTWAEERINKNDYVKNMHTENGLLDELGRGMGMSVEDVDEALCNMFDTLGDIPVMLAGTGVAAFDMRVLEAWMPRFHGRLDYRTYDIGHMRRFLKYTVEVPETWMPPEADESLHRARGDLLNALDQAIGMRDMLKQWKNSGWD